MAPSFRPINQFQRGLDVEEVLETSETCPMCESKVASKMDLRRHLVEEHSLTMIDACAVSEKEAPLSNTLPTLGTRL